MSRVFNPVYSSTSDGPDITLCRILEAVGVLANPSSNGTQSFTRVSTASTNAVVVKESAGNVYNFMAINVTNAHTYVKFYDKATAPDPAVDTPDYIIPLHKDSSVSLALGIAPFRFHNGISIAIVSTATDGGAVGAGDVVLSLTYI